MHERFQSHPRSCGRLLLYLSPSEACYNGALTRTGAWIAALLQMSVDTDYGKQFFVDFVNAAFYNILVANERSHRPKTLIPGSFCDLKIKIFLKCKIRKNNFFVWFHEPDYQKWF